MTSSILTNAASGLRLTQTLLATTSRNISHASTEGYTRKLQEAVTGPTGGVVTGSVRRATDDLLTQQLREYSASRAGAETSLAALERIDHLSGDPSRTDSLSGRVSALADSLQQLATDPIAPIGYQDVLEAAGSLARTFQNTYFEISSVSSDAIRAIPTDVAKANEVVERIAAVNREAAAIGIRGGDETDLLDERDRLVSQLSEIMSVRGFTDQRNVLHLYTADNKLLTDEVSFPLSTDLNGNVFSGNSRIYNIGGRIGANQEIFNRVAPAVQQQLDDLAGRLTESLDLAGVPIFNDGGAVAFDPTDPAQLLGYSGRIAVNQAVAADPTLLRGGAATPIGDTTLIVAARQALIGDAHTFTAAGLPTSSTLTLAAASFVGTIASRTATARQDVEGREVAEDLVRSRIAQVSEVNVDHEMTNLIQLQNAYSANARIFQAAQAMLDELMNMVR